MNIITHPPVGHGLPYPAEQKYFTKSSLQTLLKKLSGHCSERQVAGRAASSPNEPPRLVVEIDIRHVAGEAVMGQQGCSDLIRHRYHCRPSGRLDLQHLRGRLVEAEQCWRSAVQGSCP